VRPRSSLASRFSRDIRSLHPSRRLAIAISLCLAAGWAEISPCHADYVVQVGAFQSSILAFAKNAQVMQLGFPTAIERIHRPGKSDLNAILVGPYETAQKAGSAKTALANGGVHGFVRAVFNDHPAIGGPTHASSGSKNETSADQYAEGCTLSTQDRRSSSLEFQRIAAAAAEPPVPAKQTNTLPFSISGHAQTALAYTVASPDHWSKIKNTLHLAVERALGADINLKVSGRFSYDGAYDVSNFYPERVRRDQRFDGMFHETYLDVGLNDWNIRLGRQNITWGEVVGLFFADVVSAKDMREFLVPEFDYIRIPQWAARTEYFKGDFKAEAVWIPYMTYDRIGKPGSEFYPYAVPPPPGFAQNIRSERTPHSLSDSSFGLRASYLLSGWDLAAFYFNSMDANATFFRSTILAPVPTIRVRPDHERIHQAGATLSKDVGSFVFKGEAIYTWDRYFDVTRANDANGNVRQNFLDYILSAEVPLPEESRVNVQFFQRWFTNYDADIIPRRVETGASLFASTKFFHEKIEPELLLIHSLNRLDYMARFKINWYFATNWRAVAGTAFFGGKGLNLFGRFDQKDRIFAELRYTF
jgi:hypothetical protein